VTCHLWRGGAILEAGASVSPFVGIGLYSPVQVAQILRLERSASTLTANKTRDWAVGRVRRVKPVFTRQIRETDPDDATGTLTFRDMMEVLWIATLRDCGMPLQSVRIISDRLRALLGAPNPLTVAQVWTDGARVYADTIAGNGASRETKVAVRDLLDRQYQIRDIVEPFLIDKIEFEGNRPVRYFPVSGSRRIVLDPARRFGRPHVSGHGIETWALYDCARAEGSAAAASDWYEVPLDDVLAACAYEAALRGEPVVSAAA
jgi:uncharacterized protein (DUF433 family)